MLSMDEDDPTNNELTPFNPELQSDETWAAIDTYLYLYTRGADIHADTIEVQTKHQNDLLQNCMITVSINPNLSYVYRVIFDNESFIDTKDGEAANYITRREGEMEYNADPKELLTKLEGFFGDLDSEKLLGNYYQSLNRPYAPQDKYEGFRADQRTNQDQDRLHQATEPAENADYINTKVDDIMAEYGLDASLRELVETVLAARIDKTPEILIFRQWIFKNHPDVNSEQGAEDTTKTLTELFDKRSREFIF
jgi:hypothetical protein